MNVTQILDAVVSHAMATGLFERVNSHEPKNAPGNGLTCAVWADRIVPEPGASGLATTSTRVVFSLRIYSSMTAEPQDAIDPNIMSALDVLFSAYSGDFELGGNVRNVDLMGLQARAGYVNQDSRLFRTMEISLPLIVNDVWAQSP